VGRVGYIGPQHEADRSKAGSAAGRMRPKELKGGARRALPEFSHRYGHFAPQTSTTLGTFRCKTQAISPVSVSMVNTPYHLLRGHSEPF
jgi:hypothetical protein